MAVVVTWFPADHRSGAILAVTIVAGFASSILLPLAGWLTSAHGWRTALLILAAIQAVTVPLHACTIRASPLTAAPASAAGFYRGAARPALSDRTFWLLAIGFTANMAALSAMTVHLVCGSTDPPGTTSCLRSSTLATTRYRSPSRARVTDLHPPRSTTS